MKSTELTAVIVAASLMVGGTYAWQSYSQNVRNEILEVEGEAGGRLHDDFDGENKDVYVENYYSNGPDIYARIRIKEYFEYGTGAGDLSASTSGLSLLRGDILSVTTPEINDESTWDIYSYGSKATPGTPSIRTYSELKFGGSTVYMPTFNQNSTDLSADINGTMTGLDLNRDDRSDEYSDYVDWKLGDTETDLVITENNMAGSSSTHTAKETEVATIMTMEAWSNAGGPIGDMWVFDTDGWAYYAAPIKADTATGLLLDEVAMDCEITEDWYYAIDVTAQLATAGDWGEAPDGSTSGSGMYESDFSSDGLYLLNKVSGIIKATDIVLSNTDKSEFTYLDLQMTYGSVKNLLATVYIDNGTGLVSEESVTWSIELVPGGDGTTLTTEEINGTLNQNGKFSPVEGMEGNYYAITVTSDLTPSKSATVNIYVYDPAEHFLVTTEDDATALAYLELEYEDGSLYEYDVDLQLYATHIDGFTLADVIWTVEETSGSSGLTQEELNTSIDGNGLFTSTPDMIGCAYTITATYNKTVPILTNSIDVTVSSEGEFYIIAKETVTEYTEGGVALGDKEAYLIFAKIQVLEGVQYDSSNETYWSSSDMRKTVLPNWLSGYNYLSSIAVRTKIETDGYYIDDKELTPSGSGFVTEYTYDNIFLLSQPEFYTYIGLGDSRGAAAQDCWTRSPWTAQNVRLVSWSGNWLTGTNAGNTYPGVRPALWVELP